MPGHAVNLAALLPAQGADLVIEERPIPSPRDGEVLIRNQALALNPVDWKRQTSGFAISSYPTILGSGEATLDPYLRAKILSVPSQL